MKIYRLVIQTCLVIYANVAVGLGLVLKDSVFSIVFFSRPTLYIAFLIILCAVPITYSAVRKKGRASEAHFIISWYISILGYAVGWLYKWLDFELLLYVSLSILAFAISFRIWGLRQVLEGKKMS